MEDHHVDRPDVEAGQPVQLTGTNSSFGLIVLIIKALSRQAKAKGFRSTSRIRKPSFASFRSLPAWWPLQGDKTRSHPELGRQTPQRQWYFVSRHGRVGRRQACKARNILFTKQDLPKPRIQPRGFFSLRDRSRAEKRMRGLQTPRPPHLPPPIPRRGVEQPGSSSGS